MKKLLNILVLASAFLLTACGPSYDFSSPKALGESLAEQAIEENLNMQEASSILSAYLISEGLKNWKDIYPEVLEIEDDEALTETILAILENAIDGKTFEEMKDDTSPVVFEITEAAIYSELGRDYSKLEKLQKHLEPYFQEMGDFVPPLY